MQIAPMIRKTLPRLSVVLLSLALALCLNACGSSGDEASAPKQKTQTARRAGKKKASPSQPIVQEQKTDSAPAYTYDPTGKPDPFLPLITDARPQQSTAVQARKSTPLAPLQKFDLSDLKLVAIIKTDQKASALLQDPTGFGYIVKEGMLVGKNDGIIRRINGSSITIEEQIYTASGDVESKTTVISIQKSNKG